MREPISPPCRRQAPPLLARLIHTTVHKLEIPPPPRHNRRLLLQRPLLIRLSLRPLRLHACDPRRLRLSHLSCIQPCGAVFQRCDHLRMRDSIIGGEEAREEDLSGVGAGEVSGF